jgi:hypothetical protein
MYTLKIQNHYYEPLSYVAPKESGTIPVKYTAAKWEKLGNFRLTIPGGGDVRFMDIGQKQITHFTKLTWGVLISYRSLECEFRYEGGGEIGVNVNSLGQIELSYEKGSMLLTALPSIILKKPATSDDVIITGPGKK